MIRRLRTLWQRFWRWLTGQPSPSPDAAVPPLPPASTTPSTPSGQGLVGPTGDMPTARPLTPAMSEPQLELIGADEPRYELWPSLLTPREREFFTLLVEVVGNRYQLFVKVRLGDVFRLGNEPANRKYHNNQIQCKHFDFLLCDKTLCKPLLAIELDDFSHRHPGPQARDAFKDQICQQARLPLWRPLVQRAYSKAYIQQELDKRLS